MRDASLLPPPRASACNSAPSPVPGSASLPAEKLDAVDWHSWLYAPGIPEAPAYDDSYLKAARSLADAWLGTGAAGLDSQARAAYDSFTVDQARPAASWAGAPLPPPLSR